jgi:hypothetical protein
VVTACVQLGGELGRAQRQLVGQVVADRLGKNAGVLVLKLAAIKCRRRQRG